LLFIITAVLILGSIIYLILIDDIQIIVINNNNNNNNRKIERKKILLFLNATMAALRKTIVTKKECISTLHENECFFFKSVFFSSVLGIFSASHIAIWMESEPWIFPQ
jgi:hypothetical protein